jgi:choline dehydrogenase
LQALEGDYDYIVIGAGSAGAVLAARLSESPITRVLLLEAGPADDSMWIHLPIGYGKTMWSTKYNWCFHTDPEPNMNGRQIYWPRGKTLGGSSSINGLIYIRGQREDYDHWASLGNRGWGYDDVLPYFKKSETNELGPSDFHGTDGPLKVSNIQSKDELIEAFIAGAGEQGVPQTTDFNGLHQEGAGYYQLTTYNGLRCSTAVAYLKPAKRRRNLRIETNARATRIVFEGTKALCGCYSISSAIATFGRWPCRIASKARRQCRSRLAWGGCKFARPFASAPYFRMHQINYHERRAQFFDRQGQTWHGVVVQKVRATRCRH